MATMPNDLYIYEMFLVRNLPIYLVGINFNGETRTIDDYKAEELERK